MKDNPVISVYRYFAIDDNGHKTQRAMAAAAAADGDVKP